MRRRITDVLFTLRLMRRSPWFYAVVLALLTAGIGTTTAMFSVVESVLLKPLPYPDADDLTDIRKTQPADLSGHTSVGTFADWRAQATTFERMALVSCGRFSLSSPPAVPEKVDVAEVSEDFFPMFRVKPLVGRLLTADDDRPDAPLVAVISARLWRSRYGESPDVVGRTMTLNGRAYTVVGVAPAGFEFASRDDGATSVWKPFFGSRSASQVAEALKERSSNFLLAMGRRRHGVSLEEAQAQMTAIAKNLEVEHPDDYAKTGVLLVDLRESLVGPRARQLWLLFGAVALVLLVVAANTASLLLARARRRSAELATRAALGASSSTLVAQVVTETVVVFGVASLAGSAAAAALVDLLAGALLKDSPVSLLVDVRLDGRVLLASVSCCLLLGLLAAIGPAVATARVEPATVLKQSSTGAGDHKSHAFLRSVLVVAQLAVAFALLTGSALTVRAFVRSLSTPPGFEPRDLATAFLQLPARTYDADDKIRSFYRRVFTAVGDLPGVESASGNSFLPMGETGMAGSFLIECRPPPPPGEPNVATRGLVAPRYFETLRTPVLRGRDFTAEDDESHRRVVIVNESAARKFFPGEDPVGRRIAWDGDDGEAHWSEIVGLVADVRDSGLTKPAPSEIYSPFAQEPFSDMYLVARTRNPESVLAALPRLVQGLDPELAVSGLATMETRVAATVGESHRMAWILGGFASCALVLSTLGLFGLVSYATAERTRELGLRLALGSPPRAIMGLVVRGAMRLVLLGLAAGLLLSVWVAREISATVPDATSFDASVVVIPFVLGFAGLLACVMPALRAVRTPPASALRYE